MKINSLLELLRNLRGLLTAALLVVSEMSMAIQEIPDEMQKIMNQPQFQHAFWGVLVKDLDTDQVVYDLNSNKLFSPGSTTKLFTVAALLHAYGDTYRFNTPLYSTKPIHKGKLQGDLVIVGQGDLTMGGRQSDPNTLAFTPLDHTYANDLPGVSLTPEDPLLAFKSLAKQAYEKGLRELDGNVIIDDRLFETVEKRGMMLSPLMLNENLIDLVVNPTAIEEQATIEWRPQVPGYDVANQVKTVAAGGPLELEVSSDPTGHHIVIKGTIPSDQKNIVRVFRVKDPKVFARAAMLQALEKQGITVHLATPAETPFIPQQGLKIGAWTSPPLSEYAKLILKVSHNLGADLVPLLLASQKGMKSFDEGMKLLGHFTVQEALVPPDAFVYVDGAGGNENRFTPQAEVELLHYVYKLPKERFQNFFNALPILGVDGALEDVSKNSAGANHVFAKPGTGISINLGTGKPFLITQALAGYIKGKNGHLYAYEIVVNNGDLSTLDDVFAVFEMEGQLSSIIYEHTANLITTSVEEEIQTRLQLWPQYLRNKNLPAACSLFAPNLVASYPGAPDRNFDEMCKHLHEVIHDKERAFDYAPPEIEEIIVDKNMAVVRLIWTLQISNELIQERGLDVFERQVDGSWKIRISYAYPY